MEFLRANINIIFCVIAGILAVSALISKKFRGKLLSFLIAVVALYMFWTIVHLARTTSIYG